MLEIVDEAGNIHGPFATAEEVRQYVESRALGEERDEDGDERAGGWEVRRPQ